MNKKAFTLVELLVVVLIIGILSAVALPMYQGAVDKSRFSTLLPAAKSIKDAEEAMRMSTGLYTDKMEDLDISMENGELNFTFDIHNSLADPSLVRTTSPKLENVRLASYFDFNPMMAGQKHCEAKAGDERANRLCGPIMQGQELGTTTDGYNRYLLDEDIDKQTCDSVSFFWSKNNTKCFKTEKDKCNANGMPYESGFCGYTNDTNVTVGEDGICTADSPKGCNGSTINEGGLCQVTDGNSGGACQHITINNGGDCKGSWPHRACHYATINEGGLCSGSCEYSTINEGGLCKGGCKWSTINDGGVCESTVNHSCAVSTINSGGVCIGNHTQACDNVTVNDGGRCVANSVSNCNGTYHGTGCCAGPKCPASAPKCQD